MGEKGTDHRIQQRGEFWWPWQDPFGAAVKLKARLMWVQETWAERKYRWWAQVTHSRPFAIKQQRSGSVDGGRHQMQEGFLIQIIWWHVWTMIGMTQSWGGNSHAGKRRKNCRNSLWKGHWRGDAEGQGGGPSLRNTESVCNRLNSAP